MQTIAAVRVRVVTPLTIPAEKADRVLLNVHGDGFKVGLYGFQDRLACLPNRRRTTFMWGPIRQRIRCSPLFADPKGLDAQIVLREALPHAFWKNVDLPESNEANQIMASFFDKSYAGNYRISR